jgi:hypothetical protein
LSPNSLRYQIRKPEGRGSVPDNIMSGTHIEEEC